jgi:hypothetical protein
MYLCSGGCHCGQVEFEVELEKAVVAHKCNCSICQRTGYLHLIVAAKQFNLLSDADNLEEYRFHTGVARHLFCKTCGIKSYYVPRSHPDSISVNLRCVEVPEKVKVSIQSFDGQHWTKNYQKIANDRGPTS